MRLKLTRNSASVLSCSSRFDSKRKLVLIRAIEDPPVGILNMGHTNSWKTLNVYLNYSIMLAIVDLADAAPTCSYEGPIVK